MFIGRGEETEASDLERKLLLLRKRAERAVRESSIPERDAFYVASLSSRTIAYKGMLSAEQTEVYFPDLQDPQMTSALALVHQRFSTNTFPSWPLAQPFRYLAHNGEINTLRGNINWMRAREGLFRSELFGDDLCDLFPVVIEGGSDSAIIDNALEMLMLCGRSLPHAVMMLIPEAWDGHESMSGGKEGVLRVPRMPDGTVGRPGFNRFYRWGGDRCRARQKRLAPIAVLRHHRRHGCDGV